MELPKKWYNILADLPRNLDPPLNPMTKDPINPKELEVIFAKELVKQEMSKEKYIKIPEDVLEAYEKIGRPTPLKRAKNLEKFLKTPTKIYYKAEAYTATGSHKINTALAQAYYNKKEGVEKITTETGAGQWGSALALACCFFDIDLKVFMVRSSYFQKPYRKTIMETFGAEIHPSPSTVTKFGKKILKKDGDHPGTLGIAISEALELVLEDENAKYCLGSVLNHVLMHQTVIGQEAKEQFKEIGENPDTLIGCVGGGSNFAGFMFPFFNDGKEFIAVEPKPVPTITKGDYRYDYGDTAGMTPLLKMFTLGKDFQVPRLHAGGLRYHGMAPLISLLVKEGFIKPETYEQKEIFEAALIFAKTEGIIPAPESSYAIKAAIDEALKKEDKTIAFNLSGHGLLDLQGYQDFLDGKLS